MAKIKDTGKRYFNEDDGIEWECWKGEDGLEFAVPPAMPRAAKSVKLFALHRSSNIKNIAKYIHRKSGHFRHVYQSIYGKACPDYIFPSEAEEVAIALGKRSRQVRGKSSYDLWPREWNPKPPVMTQPDLLSVPCHSRSITVDMTEDFADYCRFFKLDPETVLREQMEKLVFEARKV